MKRSTRIHLLVAENNLYVFTHPSKRRKLANVIRDNRRWHGAKEARRIYRLMYGPLEID